MLCQLQNLQLRTRSSSARMHAFFVGVQKTIASAGEEMLEEFFKILSMHENDVGLNYCIFCVEGLSGSWADGLQSHIVWRIFGLCT